jgi:hypothetical protein
MYPQFGHATSGGFASSVLGRKSLKNMDLKGHQNIFLPGAHIRLGGDPHRSKIHDLRTSFVHAWSNGQSRRPALACQSLIRKHEVLLICDINTEHIFSKKTDLAPRLLTAAPPKAITLVKVVLGRRWDMLSGRSSSISRLSVTACYDEVPVKCRKRSHFHATLFSIDEIPRKLVTLAELPLRPPWKFQRNYILWVDERFWTSYTQAQRYEQNWLQWHKT